MSNKLSIIIPTYNEAENIQLLLSFLSTNTPSNDIEIIVVDGGSEDDTVEKAKKDAVIVLTSPVKGRAAQMNFGASHASSDILQFIHADTIPPFSFYNDIQQTIEEGYDAGCFSYRFDSNFFLLKINAYFTRFDKLWCRGGDQAIFIKKEVFEQLGGFPDFRIMEEYELLKALYKNNTFKIIKKDATVSARKYKKNSYLRVQLANLIVFNMYRFGASQERMCRFYSKALK